MSHPSRTRRNPSQAFALAHPGTPHSPAIHHRLRRCEVWGIESQVLKHEFKAASPINCCQFIDPLNCFVTAEAKGRLCFWSLPIFVPLLTFHFAGGFVPHRMTVDLRRCVPPVPVMIRDLGPRSCLDAGPTNKRAA